jgi:hypothetical protein
MALITASFSAKLNSIYFIPDNTLTNAGHYFPLVLAAFKVKQALL